MKPLPRKLPQHPSGYAKGVPVSVTFQADGITVVIRQDKKAHRWKGEAHRNRLLLFVLEKGFGRVDRGPGITIYRNWT